MFNDKQSAEDVLIERLVKTIMQKLYDKGLFDNYDNADDVLKGRLRNEDNKRHRPDLEEVIDVFQKFCSLMQIKENKATSNIKIQNILFSSALNDVGILLRDSSFEMDVGIVNKHPIQGTHWVMNVPECCFDSLGITSPNQLSMFIKKRNGHCFSLDTKYKV